MYDEKALEKWLDGKPNNIGHILLSRTLLRIFPLVKWPSEGVDLFDDASVNRQFMLDLFRVLNSSYALPQLKNQDNFQLIAYQLNERSLFKGSGTFYNSLITSVFRESFQSFRSTKYASRRAFTPISKAFSLVNSILFEFPNSSERIFIEIDNDRNFLHSDTIMKVNNRPIWKNDIPTWFDARWKILSSNLLLDSIGKWDYWMHWFQKRIDGEKIGEIYSYNGTSFSEFLASQTSDFWQAGADRVNSSIADWFEINRKSPDDERKGTVSEFIVDFLDRNRIPASNDQIAEAFRAANYKVLPKTMRGQLSRLASDGRIRRLHRGVYESLNSNSAMATQDGQIAAAVDDLQRYSEAMSTGSPIVISGSFFSLGETWSQSDLDVANQLKETGRCHIAKRKVDRLYDRSSQRLKNYQIWNDLIETLPELSEWLAMPPEDMARRVGVAWELSVTVGRFIDLDKRLSADPNSPHLQLDADVRLSLEDVNGSVGTLLREFPTGAAMDDRHREWHASQEAIDVARAIFANVEKTNVLLSTYIPLVARALNASDIQSVQGRKSAGWGVGTVKRIGFASIIAAGSVAGGIVGGATGEIGAEIVRQTQLSNKAAELVLKSKDDLIELSKDAPADIRNAVEDIIKRIEEAQK